MMYDDSGKKLRRTNIKENISLYFMKLFDTRKYFP